MKKTAYQKLKDRNESLQKDIYSLLGQNGTVEKVVVETKWLMCIEAEKAIWSGQTGNVILNGIYERNMQGV